MNRFLTRLRRQGKRLLAIAIALGLFVATQLPSLSASERSQLAAQFHFTRTPLPELPGAMKQARRRVHPSLEHHAGWISAVGAAIALNDLDGDGLPNDACYVDTRTDQVIVTPVPGPPQRYQPFGLTVNLPYESDTTAPMGCIPNDLNEDGQMDLLVYYWGRTPIGFLAQGETSSEPLSLKQYRQQEMIPPDPSVGIERWYTNAATFADFDGDGHQDLLIGNYFQDGSRILDAHASGTESMQHSMTRAFNGGTNHLLQWTGAAAGPTPTVTYAAVESLFAQDIAHAWTLGIGAADLDGDLLPEIYFANDFGPDRLLHNQSQPGQFQFSLLEGRKGFTTPNSKVLGHDSFKGMGIDFGDVNHDGLLDLYVSNIADEYALEESHFLYTSTGDLDAMDRGIAPYIDQSEPLGVSRSSWGWETKFGDFNNDGELEALQATGFSSGETNRWPELQELAMGNDELLSHAKVWPRFKQGDDLSGHDPNPFFVRSDSGRYFDLAADIGLDQPAVTRGIATADVDGDGDLDFAIANQWSDSQFFRNDSPHLGHSLSLDLRLPTPSGSASRPAIGATAIVHRPQGPDLVAQVDGGNGHSGVRSPGLHFGLGDVSAETPLDVELHWRDGQGQVHENHQSITPGAHTLLLASSNP